MADTESSSWSKSKITASSPSAIATPPIGPREPASVSRFARDHPGRPRNHRESSNWGILGEVCGIADERAAGASDRDHIGIAGFDYWCRNYAGRPSRAIRELRVILTTGLGDRVTVADERSNPPISTPACATALLQADSTFPSHCLGSDGGATAIGAYAPRTLEKCV